jgi:hypothetical protein
MKRPRSLRPRTLGLAGALVAIALTVSIFAAGCGTAAQAAAGAPASGDAQAILQKAFANAGQVTSGAGTINASLTVTADQSAIPAGAQGLLGQPLKLSGTYSFDKTAKTGQADLSLAVAGQNLPVSLEAINGQAWLQLLGQWYQTPAGTEKSGDTATTAQQSTASTVKQELSAAGIDPTTLLTNVTLVGDETINGVATSHISATIDVSKIIALKQTMTTAAGSSTTAGTSASDAAAKQQEIQKLQAGLTTAVKTLTIDVWVTKDTTQVRQAELKATVVPPADMLQSAGAPDTTTSQAGTSLSTATTESADQAATKAALQSIAQGIKSVSLDVTVSIDPSATPKPVTAPTGAKPWTDLQTALKGFEKMFSGVLGGASTTTSVE